MENQPLDPEVSLSVLIRDLSQSSKRTGAATLLLRSIRL